MRNSPLKGLLSKKDKSPLQVNPNFDRWYFNPKAVVSSYENKEKKGGISKTAKRAIKNIKSNKS